MDACFVSKEDFWAGTTTLILWPWVHEFNLQKTTHTMTRCQTETNYTKAVEGAEPLRIITLPKILLLRLRLGKGALHEAILIDYRILDRYTTTLSTQNSCSRSGDANSGEPGKLTSNRKIDNNDVIGRLVNRSAWLIYDHLLTNREKARHLLKSPRKSTTGASMVLGLIECQFVSAAITT